MALKCRKKVICNMKLFDKKLSRYFKETDIKYVSRLLKFTFMEKEKMCSNIKKL